MAYKAPDIGSLSAHEYNKIRQSFDKYQQSQKGFARPGLDRGSGYRDMSKANREAEKRNPFKRGSYGIEDEYRYMVSQGFRPQSMQVAPQTTAPPQDPSPPADKGGQPDTLDVNKFPEPPTGPSETDTLVSKFSEQIAAMQQGFMQSMQQQAAMFQQMQASQNERMEALQQQMLQTQIAQQPRPEVAGVKMATGAAGTPMQIARRGVTGAFGRRGMRISSLNV